MQDAVRRHDAILHGAVVRHGGHVFKTIGDAFCSAFERPKDAVAAMLAAQRMLAAEDFSALDGLRVRAAIHTVPPTRAMAIISVRRLTKLRGSSPSVTAVRFF